MLNEKNINDIEKNEKKLNSGDGKFLEINKKNRRADDLSKIFFFSGICLFLCGTAFFIYSNFVSSFTQSPENDDIDLNNNFFTLNRICTVQSKCIKQNVTEYSQKCFDFPYEQNQNFVTKIQNNPNAFLNFLELYTKISNRRYFESKISESKFEKVSTRIKKFGKYQMIQHASLNLKEDESYYKKVDNGLVSNHVIYVASNDMKQSTKCLTNK